MKPKSFADWAAAGGHIPKGIDSKEWNKTVKKYVAGGEVEMQAGGFARLAKSLKGAQQILPQAEREANLAKLLEPSKVKERLYHATPADVKEFKPGGNNPARSGPAIWMTPDKEFQPAAHNIRVIPGKPGYMYGSSSDMFTPGTNVMPVYSSIKNPLITSEKTWRKDFERFGGSPWTLTPDEVKNIRSAGHDGIMYYDDKGKLQEVVAFDPNQVKSAIGNRGTYDINDPDITKAGGGLIKGMAKALKGTQEALPAAQREANLQKLLEPSAVKQRLYHGTMATEGGKGQEAIRRIKPSKEGALGSGVYLTPQSEFASTYAGFPARSQLERDIETGSDFAKSSARQLLDRMDRGVVEPHEVGGNMLPVYAQIKNPLVLEGKGDAMIEALVKLGVDEATAGKMVERAYETKGYIGKEVESRARAQGYDGLMQYRDGNLTEVVSYNPNAIKSATGNVGTYDVTSPDLSKAKGGEVKMQDGGAAFGVFPQMKGKRSKQDPEAAKRVPLDLARGFVAGSLGAPADILNIPAAVYSLATGKDMPYEVPYGSEHFQKILPGKPTTPTGEFASGLGALAGGFYTGPGSGIRAAMAVPKAAVKAGKDFIMAAPQGAPRMFIGPKAKTWDQAKADRAAQMEKEGRDPVDIWRETGTFRSADGILRQEISDVGAVHRNPTQLKELGKQKKEEATNLQQRLAGIPGQKDMFPKALTEAKRPAREKVKTLKEEADELMRHSDVRGQRAKFALEHPELYKAYPELGEIPVYQGNRGIGGERASIRGGPQDLEMEITQSGLRGDPRSSALHEMQHAIQTIESMGPGGSPAMAFKNPKAFEILEELRKKALEPMSFEAYAKHLSHIPEDQLPKAYERYVKDIPNAVKAMDRELQSQAAMEYYRRLAGEAEARATQAREPLTQSQRAAEFPYSSYDVLPEDLIVNPAKSFKDGGEVNMQEGGAAFGVFPQMKGRRSKQDSEAAKTFPIDVARGFVSGALGMPGDIESIVRMLPGFSEKTILPTSEDIEKRLPLRSDTPAARAATGLGQIGGGFYTGPLSGARAAVAVPKAVMQAGRDFVQAAGQPAVNVIKPKGGNWLTGNVEKQVGRMKMADEMTPEYYANRQRLLEEARAKGDDRTVRAISEDLEVSRRNDAINNWIDRNLTNYIKKEMATPEDPVRRLAEEGILHIKPFGDQGVVSSRLQNKRMGAGFSPVGEGKSEAAKFWERQADISIDPYPAGSYKHGTLEALLEANPWLKNVPDEQMINYAKGINDLGFDHIVDVLRQDVRAGRIRPEQLSKVSMEQAVRRTYEFDQEMAKKMRDAQIKATEGMPVVKEYPEGYKWVDLTVPKLESLPEGTSYQKLSNGQVRIVDAGGNPLTAGERSEAAALKSLEKQRGQELLEGALKYEGETMGHCVGGYCPDVLEGRSRIYSLRDAKGEPHVTIEVRPIEDMARERIEPAISEFGQKGYRVEDQFFLNKDEALAYVLDDIRRFEPNIKPEIIQIKGKQNKAPKEEYLPFVQDFVRSGQWSEVGDFANTGLIKIDPHSDLAKGLTAKGVSVPSYVSSNELTGLLKQAEVGSYVNPSRGETFINPNHPDWADNGMKRGGEVKMQVGGIAQFLKTARTGAKGGPKKLTQAEIDAARALGLEIPGVTVADPLAPPTMRMSEALGITGSEGKTLNITEADRSRVFGPNRGGVGFSALQLYSPPHAKANTVWGFGNETVAKKKIRQGDPDKTIWTTYIGSPEQHKSNTVVVKDAINNLQQANKSGIVHPEQIRFINERIRSSKNDKGNPLFPEDFDITDPQALSAATTFERRAIISDALSGVGVRKPMISKEFKEKYPGVKYQDASQMEQLLLRETDPALIGVNTYDVGPHLFTMDKNIIVRPDLNEAFPFQVTGTDLGVRYNLAPLRLAAPDWAAINAPEGAPINAWKMSRGRPSQFVSEKYLTNLQRAGYAKGGKVGALSKVEKRNK